MLWKEKERSRIRAAQMNDLRGLAGIRGMDRVPNAQIRELCGMKMGLDEGIDEGVLRWFAYVKRVERGMIAKRAYAREFVGSRSAGRPRKRWLDTVKVCLRKKGLDVRQARRMVQDRSEWRGFVRGNAWGVTRGMNP